MKKLWAVIAAYWPSWLQWGVTAAKAAAPEVNARVPDTVPEFELPKPCKVRWLSAAATAQGGRTKNEDTVDRFGPNQEVCVVADGMGGANRGEVASQAAVRAVGKFYGEHSSIAAEPEGWFRGAFAAANTAIVTALERASGGTTLTAVRHNQSGQLDIAWLGDSPVIHVHGASACELTKPHTLAQVLIERGVDPAEVRRDFFHTLFRYLGINSEGAPMPSEPDNRRFYVKPGDWLVICSDGLTNALSLQEIATLLMAAADSESASQALMELALSKDPRDNVSFILVRYLEDPDGSS